RTLAGLPATEARRMDRGRASFLVLLGCLVAALAATWPLATRLTTAIPRGAERESTVPLFSLWTLWWNADRAGHGFVGYWNAPIFHPQASALALSEPQTLAGLLVAPLWLADAPPALAYNAAVLAFLAANGFFTVRLLEALGAPWWPALVGGLVA